jgi:hypothetical protein
MKCFLGQMFAGLTCCRILELLFLVIDPLLTSPLAAGRYWPLWSLRSTMEKSWHCKVIKSYEQIKRLLRWEKQKSMLHKAWAMVLPSPGAPQPWCSPALGLAHTTQLWFHRTWFLSLGKQALQWIRWAVDRMLCLTASGTCTANTSWVLTLCQVQPKSLLHDFIEFSSNSMR